MHTHNWTEPFSLLPFSSCFETKNKAWKCNVTYTVFNLFTFDFVISPIAYNWVTDNRTVLVGLLCGPQRPFYCNIIINPECRKKNNWQPLYQAFKIKWSYMICFFRHKIRIVSIQFTQNYMHVRAESIFIKFDWRCKLNQLASKLVLWLEHCPWEIYHIGMLS